MAKFKGILGGKITGKVGNLVFTQVAGVGTVAREYVAQPSNPRTEAQQAQRTKLANLVNFYRAFSGVLKGAFETKKASQSDYNAFVGKNLANNPIALSKQEAGLGAVVVAPYILSEGSLRSIGDDFVSGSGETTVYLNLSVPSLTSLSDITIAALSQEIIANNPGFVNGMQISVVLFINEKSGSPAIPRAAVQPLEWTIDIADTRKFSELGMVSQIFSIQTGVLQIKLPSDITAFACILSQKVGGTLKVSSSSINMLETDILDEYSTDAQRTLAAESYGESAEIFLNPGGGSQPVPGGDGDNNLE